MNDDFEDLLKRWLRDRGTTDRSTLQALAGNVAALPPRRRRQPSNLATAAALIVALGLAAFAIAPRLSSGTGEASPGAGEASPGTGGASPVPPDPAAFAGDPRLARCGATVDTAMDAFEMVRASDYRLHLPAMLLAPELDLDAPAFVVVYRGMNPFPRLGGAPPPPGQTWQPRSLEPGRHDVCVLVGADVASAEMTVYSDVDITGLTVDVGSAPTHPSGPPPTPDIAAPSITPEPAPAWAGDARAALQCDGQPTEFGMGWQRGSLQTTDRGTPELALAELADRVNHYGQPFPTAGFIEIGRTDDSVAFGHQARGGTRAIAVLRSTDVGGRTVWFSAAVATCESREFGPDAAPGVRTITWTDSAGTIVPSTVVKEVADCYFGSQLVVDGRLYVWAPNGDSGGAYDQAALESKIGVIEALPGAAVDTGYHSEGRRLFLAVDRKAVYVALLDGIQRWPHVKGDEVSRIDCN